MDFDLCEEIDGLGFPYLFLWTGRIEIYSFLTGICMKRIDVNKGIQEEFKKAVKIDKINVANYHTVFLTSGSYDTVLTVLLENKLEEKEKEEVKNQYSTISTLWK